MQRKRFLVLPLLLVGAIVLFKFLGAEKFVNPETGRVGRVGLSEQQEDTLGLQAYEEVLSTSDVVRDGPEVRQSEEVVRRLATAAGEAGNKMEWQVSVVRSPEVNAFCLPGGKMVVYTGILPVAETPAGLATVLGHEMAHATSRHGAQRMFQTDLAQTALQGAQLSLGDADPQTRQAILAALGLGAKVGVILPFSRSHESEADEVGLRYMARAGYDPRESVAFWERMSAQAGGANPPEFLSTHPSPATRIERLKELLPRALEEYRGPAPR